MKYDQSNYPVTFDPEYINSTGKMDEYRLIQLKKD